MPNSIGHQDLAALIARQPAVTERWRAHVRNSTFGTIHAASLSFPRLVGASIPDPYFTQLASVDPRALEATGSIPLNVPLDPVVAAPVYDFPVVDRRLKGDRLNVKSAPQAPEQERPQPSKSSKTKDMASRLPGSGPSPAEQLPQSAAEAVSQPALAKGNRLSPSQSETAEAKTAEGIYLRAGLAPGQDTQAKRVLGTGPRQPLVVASPAEPVEDKVLRRAGIAVGATTLAKRVLGVGPRPPVVVASPAEPVEDKVLRRAGIPAGKNTLAKRVLGIGPRQPVETASAPAGPVAAVTASVEPVTPGRRSSLAAAHLNRMKAEARRISTPSAETADLESARADLKGQIMPPRAQLAETADLESQRADLLGPIVPPALPVAEAPVSTAPQPAEQIAEAEPAATLDAPASEPESQVVDAPLAPESQTAAVVSVPAPASDAAEEAAPAPRIAEVVPPAKTTDRFNEKAAEQLAQFTKPSAQTRIFFGTRELGVGRNEWEAWDPGEVPTVLAPPHVDTEIKRAALDPLPDADTEKAGETIAPKGEVTGEGKRPRTPAERLSLVGASRVKHQKCLANAIYFEARGEIERGQMAVAQVILNRAFSGYYPGNVCDVVYQNAHRHLACQFTFACDNHKDIVRDKPRWEIADRIAGEALDGKFWLPEIGKATHYHATYVNPWWVRTMTKHARLGVHIFYRPKRWGDLDEIPVWGDRLEVTGSIKREASPASPETKNDDKRADAQAAAPVRRSVFDPVEPITPGG